MSRGFSGLHAWIVQRVTAIYIAIATLILAYCLTANAPDHFQQWHDIVSIPYITIFLALLVISILYHAWIGIRDVILDYVKPVGLRLFISSMIIFILLGSGFWFFRALLLVAIFPG